MINTITTNKKQRAKIEVFPKLNKGKFRKIDIYGSPDKIFRACERIFNIEEKYINFNKNDQKNINNKSNNNNNKKKEQSFNISTINSNNKSNNIIRD